MPGFASFRAGFLRNGCGERRNGLRWLQDLKNHLELIAVSLSGHDADGTSTSIKTNDADLLYHAIANYDSTPSQPPCTFGGLWLPCCGAWEGRRSVPPQIQLGKNQHANSGVVSRPSVIHPDVLDLVEAHDLLPSFLQNRFPDLDPVLSCEALIIHLVVEGLLRLQGRRSGQTLATTSPHGCKEGLGGARKLSGLALVVPSVVLSCRLPAQTSSTSEWP
mmetsp:Transcript_35549/g.49584  ORF Transcript_35549/g.49584 Transcript_35549/m.49584 type:complete len:219 (+) Transcript_35549:560-1216(+)